MDMNWQAMLREAANASLERNIESITAVEQNACACFDLPQEEIRSLGEKILCLPQQGVTLLFSRYCFRLSPQETEFFFQIKNAKGQFRFYRDLLSSSMGLSSEEVISDASLEQACELALKDYLRTELKENPAAHSGRKGRSHLLFRRIRKAIAVAAVVLALSFSMAIAVNVQFREKVITWVVETFERYSVFELQSDGETVQPDLQSYKPTYLPDGAELLDTIVQPEMVTYEFVIDDSNSFEILLSKSDTKVYLNAENAEINSFNQNGVAGYFFEKEDLNYVCIEHDGCFFAVCGSIDLDELMKISAGITK